MKVRSKKRGRLTGMARARLLSFVTILIPVIVSCTGGVTISMDGKNPPTFKFKRNLSEVSNLLMFRIEEIAPENAGVPYLQQQYEKNVTLWRIVAVNGEVAAIDSLPPISYGQVPPGFVQEIPKDGAPPTLAEGKIYEAGGPYAMMPKAMLRFVIRDGKAVQTAMQ